jgi:hypothetical protein
MKPINRDQLLTESFDLLSKVLEEAHILIQKGDLREAFVYRHARNISQLGQAILCLESHDQPDSCPIIARAMIESLFKLVAATKATDAAVEIVLHEVITEIKKIEDWIKILGDDNDSTLKETVAELKVFAKDLETKHGIQSKKNWNIFECAKASNLGEFYRQDYFLFSKHTHATASGIIAQENETVRDRVLRILVFIVLCSVGHLVQIVETKTPQKHIDEAALLVDEAISYIKQNQSGKLPEQS